MDESFHVERLRRRGFGPALVLAAGWGVWLVVLAGVAWFFVSANF